MQTFEYNTFECIERLSYANLSICYRGYLACKYVTEYIERELPNNYIYNYIEYIREMPFKDDEGIYNSFVDSLMKVDSMSEEDALLYMTETLGLERISLDDYKELIKETPIN